MLEIAEISRDRRRKYRFPIRRELRYKLLDEDTVVDSGLGRTIDIGSGGVAFSTDRPLKQGLLIELSISWPVLLEASCPMRLVVFGRVVRQQDRRWVSSVEKYEFRTQARYFEPSTARTDSMLERWAVGLRKAISQSVS